MLQIECHLMVGVRKGCWKGGSSPTQGNWHSENQERQDISGSHHWWLQRPIVPIWVICKGMPKSCHMPKPICLPVASTRPSWPLHLICFLNLVQVSFTSRIPYGSLLAGIRKNGIASLYTLKYGRGQRDKMMPLCLVAIDNLDNTLTGYILEAHILSHRNILLWLLALNVAKEPN